MAFPKFTKDPSAILDYTQDWSQWLPAGDTISSATAVAAAADGDETPLEVDSLADTDDTVTVWLSGGTVGASYDVTVHIITAAGREDDRTITIQVKQR